MKERLIQHKPELMGKKCDRCCQTCTHLQDRGLWYQCLKDGKETFLTSYCSSYRG